MEKRAWLTFLSSNNYYIYLLLGLYKNLLDTKTKYPIYCGVTQDVTAETRQILTTVGIKLIDLDTTAFRGTIMTNSTSGCVHYAAAFTKLALLDTQIEKQFDKIVYIDTDMQVLANIDDLFEKPHMSAVADCAPMQDKTKKVYAIGCSIFCSGLFVWDFKNNPGKGHDIITNLNNLNMKVYWHDQNVLNYYYQNWNTCNELHLDPTYALMNLEDNFVQIPNPKVIHYVNRIRNDWPFSKITKIRERNWTESTVAWIKQLELIVTYFNTTYNLHIQPIYSYNLIKLTEAQEKAELADGKPNTYLYF